jgi:hypothetical protein
MFAFLYTGTATAGRKQQQAHQQQQKLYQQQVHINSRENNNS